MKIKVDELPKEPKKCLFSKFDCEYGWVCQFSMRRCRDTSKCEFLSAEGSEE